MKVRYKLSLLLIGLMLIGCLYITQSYALWIITKEQTKENEMEVGCFSIGFSEQSESINLNNTYPMIDSLGLSSDPYTFTITNTCTINNNYVLTLNTINTNTLDVSKIKYALHKSTEAKPEVGSKLSRINTNTENLNVKNLGTSYILDTGVLSGGTKEGEEISGGEEVTYNLYIWIDDIAGNEVEGQTFEASINVINVATESNNQGELFGSEVAKCGANGKDAATCMKENAYLDPINLAYDNASANSVLDNNLRYIGASPNNYIDIGDKDGEGKPILWRIIGVMNNITSLDNGEKQESLIKVIRAENIGYYSWDSSPDSINSGLGVNEWSEADLMKLLNPKETYSDTPVVGGSLYWNSENGYCYSEKSESNKTCDFTSSGISEEAKEKIAKVRWNTGTAGEAYDGNKITAIYMYEAERSSHNGKEQCTTTGGDKCNDELERKVSWEGYIGLMYPSDYGYAVGGEVRDTCLNKSMYSYDSGNCDANNWVKPGIDPWTMTSVPFTSNSYNVFFNNGKGSIRDFGAYYPLGVVPVGYLKSSVKIISGNGTEENPFVLEA